MGSFLTSGAQMGLLKESLWVTVGVDLTNHVRDYKTLSDENKPANVNN